MGSWLKYRCLNTHTYRPRGETRAQAAWVLRHIGTRLRGLHLKNRGLFQLAGASRGVAGTRRGRLRRRRRRRLGGGDTGAAACGGGERRGIAGVLVHGIEFEGEGEPDAIIVSDLPMQGSSRTQMVQMTKAIRQVLSERG